MPTAASAHMKRETLNLRIKPEDRILIGLAARARGEDRTAFVLDAAHAAAEEVLLEQTVILADPAAYAAFLTQLGAAPKAGTRLRKAMQTPAPWD